MVRVTGPSRDQTLVGVAAVVGAAAQALTGLLTILLAPAALVAAITAVAGANQVRRDLDAAALRFGVALLASSVVSIFSLLTGVPGLVALSVGSNVLFAFALVRTRRMAATAHDRWGRVHRDRARRQAALQRRRDEQASRSAAPASPSSGPAQQDDDTAWWDDLS